MPSRIGIREYTGHVQRRTPARTEGRRVREMGIIRTLKQAKRIVVIVVGYTILIIGIALMVLPGPAFIVIPVGLGILATELVWARKLVDKFKGRFDAMRDAARAKKARRQERK